MFYQYIINEETLKLTLGITEISEAYKTEINRINEIINKFYDFINILNKLTAINPLDIDNTEILIDDTATIGKMLFGDKEMTNDQYLKELFKMFFLANLYVDFAVIKIHDNLTITIKECITLIDKITIENIKQNAEYEHLKKYVKEGDTLELVLCKYKYNTPIIESPAVILQEHNKFCDLIKSSTTINTDKMKIIGLRNAYTTYTNTCSRLYAASNYTYLSNQAATFMIYYWTDLVNSYLITKAIRETDCILLIITFFK
jgi:hypothetical protein